MRSIISAGEQAPLGRKTSAQQARSKALTVPETIIAGRPGCSCLARRTSSLPSIWGMRRSQRRRSSEPGVECSIDLECLLGGGGGDDAVAAGFEEEGADREYLFVVVYAEDRLLGPQCSLASAGRRRNDGSGRWARPEALLVCQSHGPGVFRYSPAVRRKSCSGA